MVLTLVSGRGLHTVSALQSLPLRTQRRALGQFYTPVSIAQALANWAIRAPTDRVLDPSYGGCAFFAAATNRLGTLGASQPGGQLRGVDIDAGAKAHLEALLGTAAPRSQFRTADFMSL